MFKKKKTGLGIHQIPSPFMIQPLSASADRPVGPAFDSVPSESSFSFRSPMALG